LARKPDFRATEHQIVSHVLWPMREVPARSASRGAAKLAEVFWRARNYRQGFQARGYGRVVPWLMAGH
jgi:hypothetical protein